MISDMKMLRSYLIIPVAAAQEHSQCVLITAVAFGKFERFAVTFHILIRVLQSSELVAAVGRVTPTCDS
jgi:hypothetical protein